MGRINLLANKNLDAGLLKLHLTLSAEKQSQLIAYLHLLQKWNKAYNLTAITNFDKMISHHLLDSLSIASYITGENIVDVGSGAGLPGIPLSVYFPERQFVLLDSIGKKTRFLNHIVRELKLQNVTVTQTRAEDYQVDILFDTMTARAVGSLEYLMTLSKHLLQKNGRLCAMKSDSKAEIIPEGAEVILLSVPGIVTSRSLILINNM